MDSEKDEWGKEGIINEGMDEQILRKEGVEMAGQKIGLDKVMDREIKRAVK